MASEAEELARRLLDSVKDAIVSDETCIEAAALIRSQQERIAELEGALHECAHCAAEADTDGGMPSLEAAVRDIIDIAYAALAGSALPTTERT